MAFKDEALEILKRNYSKFICSSGVKVYWNGDIPQRILDGAKNTYVGNVSDDDILLIMDTTLFHSGKEGITFTVDGIYVKEMWASPEYVSYENYQKFSSCSETWFHIGNLKATLQEINKVLKRYNSFMAQAAKMAAGGETESTGDIFGDWCKGLKKLGKWADKKVKIKMYTQYRDDTKGILNVLSEKINQELDYENTEEVVRAINALYVIAVATTDMDKLIAISGIPKEEHLDYPEEIIQIDLAIINGQEDYGVSPLNLKKSAHLFYQKMSNILSELDVVDDEDELVELWERSANAAMVYRKKLKETIKDLNIIIEGMSD